MEARKINVMVVDKIATADSDALYVCGNSDYAVVFNFDGEWDEHESKTARFSYNGSYTDVVFQGNECPVPVLSDVYGFKVGVFAGNLRTSTPAYVAAKKSILCENGSPAAPMDDVYNQLMALINDLAKDGVTDEAIQQAVAKYMAENPAVVEEIDPTVPEWAKQPEKPTYTAEEIGAQPMGNYALEEHMPIVEEDTQKYSLVEEADIVDVIRYTPQSLSPNHQEQARANIGAADAEVVHALSEEMAKQATPEMFGATGDGATDDAAAIAQALASSKTIVFDGTKTYAVGTTITVPADVHVDFRGATIVPMGNHDVIRVMPGSLIENVVIRCGGVIDWDSAAIVLYGGDHFRAYNPTTIRNVKMYCNTGSTAGTTKQGIGVKLYGDNFGDFIEGVTTEEISTYGFGVGMLFEGVPDDMENPTGGLVYIGANKFRGYWSFYDNVGIKMASRYPNTHITNNLFTDLQIEPKNVPQKEKRSSYGVYCQGFQNYFDGCLYDYFYEHTAVYFGSGSNRNVLKTSAGRIYDVGWCEDLGIANVVTTFSGENTNDVPYAATTPRMTGNQDDCLAYIDKRGECTLESFDADPVFGSLANVFNPNPSASMAYRAINPEKNDRRARITINCKTAIRRLSNLYLQFYSAPKSVKITYYNDTDATVVYDAKNNVNKTISIYNHEAYGDNHEYNVAKIVIELGGFNKVYANGADTYGEWELVRIMGVDSYKIGDAWLSRNGGDIYGSVKFTRGNGVVLTAENGKKFLLSVSDTGVLSTSEYIEAEAEAPEVAVLTPTLKAGATWYDAASAGAEQNTITRVTFNAAYESTGTEDASWPCDEDGNGNIMAYRTGTEVVIKSTTGSEGVKLNADSSFMFANDGTNANFAALTAINGTETLRADKNTSIKNFCQKCSNLTGPIYIPDGVTEMGYAFANCSKMTTPPVLPDGVKSLATTFSACTSLQYLPEIPDTVTSINYAFQNCTAATSLPSKIPAKVSAMTSAFKNCAKVSGTLEVNAEKINSYTGAFDGAGRDTDGIVLTGTSPYLAQLAATNTQGKVTVAS